LSPIFADTQKPVNEKQQEPGIVHTEQTRKQLKHQLVQVSFNDTKQ